MKTWTVDGASGPGPLSHSFHKEAPMLCGPQFRSGLFEEEKCLNVCSTSSLATVPTVLYRLFDTRKGLQILLIQIKFSLNVAVMYLSLLPHNWKVW